MSNAVSLVTGATGQQGGAVARALLAAGQTVRVLARDFPRAESLVDAGARVVVGDMTDRQQMERACRGAESVFLMGTPYAAGPEAEWQQLKTCIDAAQNTGVKHVVYSSVQRAVDLADVPHYAQKIRAEEYLQASGLAWTILRPVFFMDNFGADALAGNLLAGRLHAPMPPHVATQLIAVDDIGHAAATVLAAPEAWAGKTLDLAGDALTWEEIAAAIGSAIGRTVDFYPLPPEWVAESMGPDYAAYYDWLWKEGFTASLDGMRETLGFQPKDFATYLSEARWTLDLRIELEVHSPHSFS